MTSLLNDARNMMEKLRIRASIRLNAKNRRSVQEGQPDRLAEQLYAAADLIENLSAEILRLQGCIIRGDQ